MPPQDEQQPGGLLSKVVKFVRNPGLGWADAEQGEDRDSLYSKQVLKEMIERKRANDFVRKREFDQLRKLRQRGLSDGGTLALSSGASSLFDSSQSGDGVQREGTIKKIDEIEAQMARQWPRSRESVLARPAPPPPQSGGQPFAATVHTALPGGEPRPTDFAATDVMPPAELPNHGLAAPVEDMLPDVDWSFGADADGGFISDPGLEEAAIRFANGDDAGAEAALLALLGTDMQAPAQRRAWDALFDLYRATGQQSRFQSMAIDYAVRCHRPAPSWKPLADAASLRLPEAAGVELEWSCPAVLDAREVAALAARAAECEPAVLELEWSSLVSMRDDAVAPLAELLTTWSGQSVLLGCTGTGRLDQLLRRHTVSGQRAPHDDWWRLRLVWLRVARRPDEFDLVALDYCVTYDVVPPSWEAARCNFSATGVAPLSDLPALPSAPLDAPTVAGGLTGVVLGDASARLAPFAARVPPDAPLLIACEALVRIDFAAAGSVLNWVASQQAAGRRVQFRGPHRLVAVFFHVIGVAEHATILPQRA